MFNLNIGKYYETKSDIHEVYPVVKILSLLLFIILCCISNNVVFSIILLLFSLILLVLTRVPINLFIYRTVPILILNALLLIVYILFGFNPLNIIIKLLSLSLYYSSYIYTTKIVDTNKGLYDIFKFTKINNNNFVVILTITIHFISIIINEFNKTINIQKIRGKTINYLNTAYYSIKKIKERINIIYNNYRLKDYNFNYTQKRDYFVGLSVLGAHLILFVVYFFGKI